MHTSKCARVEKKFAKCLKDAPNRGCAEVMSDVVECRGSKICKDSCGEEYRRWRLCHKSMMSVARYRDENGRLYNSCLDFVSSFVKCDAGWQWPIEGKDPNPSLRS